MEPMEQKLKMIIRAATPEDALMLLKWRNDPYVRAMSRHGDIIDTASHCQWYAQALQSPDKILFIGEVEGKSIGMVRFDRHRSSLWEVSILLAPEARGQRNSRELLKMAINNFEKKYRKVFLLAMIKQCNAPSIRIFKSLNFKIESENLKYLVLILNNQIIT